MTFIEATMDAHIENISNFTLMTDKSRGQTMVSSVTYYMCGPLLTTFIMIGILGNTACLYVFVRRRPMAGNRSARLSQPIYVYLLSLAAWDLILLIASFVLYNLHVIVAGQTSKPSISHPLYLHSLPYFYYLTNTAHYCANWVVVALGLERYFALCHPFKHRMFIDGRKRAVYVVCVISLAGTLYTLPRLFETSVQSDEGELEIQFNSLQQNVYYQTFYRVIGGMCLYSVGPFLCLLYVSIRVSTAVRQQRLFQAETRTIRMGRRDGLSGTVSIPSCQKQPRFCIQRKDSRDSSYSINVMLIAVMVKLLFVHSLPTALDVAEATMGEEAFESRLMDYLADISILLVVVNSSCNFFVYFICSQQFRDEIRTLRKHGSYGSGSGSRILDQGSSAYSDQVSAREYSPMLLHLKYSTVDYARKTSHVDLNVAKRMSASTF